MISYAKGKADDINAELKAFLDFMLEKTSDDPFIMRLEDSLNAAKQNAKERRNYMLKRLYDWERDSESLREGLTQGRTETLEAAIEFMKLHGMSEENINSFKDLILQS